MSSVEELPVPKSEGQVGKFEFSVTISDKKPDGEQRVNVLANWLLAEWERANHSNQKPRGNVFGRN